jgi:hypothetical protein
MRDIRPNEHRLDYMTDWLHFLEERIDSRVNSLIRRVAELEAKVSKQPTPPAVSGERGQA